MRGAGHRWEEVCTPDKVCPPAAAASQLPEPQEGPALCDPSDAGLSSSLVLKRSTQQAGGTGRPSASGGRTGFTAYVLARCVVKT